MSIEHLDKKIHKNYKMRVFQNIGHMISYYQLKKNRDAPKLGQNWSKLTKIEKNYGISYYQLKKIRKKLGCNEN